MSVATQTLGEPCHMPCPDLGCYSLNAVQKARGLENLQNVRHSLKERQLEPCALSTKNWLQKPTTKIPAS